MTKVLRLSIVDYLFITNFTTRFHH